MPEAGWVLHCGAAVASFAGFAWLALAMDVHWQQARGSEAPSSRTRRLLRLAGCAGLAASAALCLLTDRPSMAALVWLTLLIATAPLVALVLAWRPRWLRALWP